MTTPHTEQPAEGPDESLDDPDTDPEPSNPDKTGESIDDSTTTDDDPDGPLVPPDPTN